MFYHIWKSGQKGDATRVASGCSKEEEENLKKVHEGQIDKISPGNFHIHFTPDYSHVVPAGNYHFFNKGFGIRHWLENGLQYAESAHIYNDDIFIILDPDQVLLRPFTHDFTNETVAWKIPKTKPQQYKVQHGVPFAQEYLFSVKGIPSVDMVKVGATEDELPSPVNDLTEQEVFDGYRVGPPYIATGKDFYKLVIKWTEFAPGVFNVMPGHITEMYAYLIAAAHLKLPHQISHSFMISETEFSEKEGWSLFYDQISDTQVCEKPEEGRHIIQPNFNLPHTLHFCHRYILGKWFFNKYFVPEDFMSCHSPLLSEPPQNVSLLYDFGIQLNGHIRTYKKEGLTKSIAFMMCQMIHAMNEAATHYKKHNCDSNTVNMGKTFTFHENMDIPLSARSTKNEDAKNADEVRETEETMQDENRLQKDGNDKDDESSYHIVFSTGCAHQDWQSYLMFYYIWRSGQKGDATRVASGCSKKEEENLKKLHEEQIDKISPGKFHMHFTPDYSQVVPGGNYHFFNKGFGILHWLEHGLKYSENAHLYENAIFIILDPDHLLLRPFTNDFSDTMTLDGISSLHDGDDNNSTTSSNIKKTIFKKTKTKKQQFVVQHGVPFAQQYSFSLNFDWFPKVNMSNVVASKDELPSPVNNLTLQQAVEGYPIGPPYVMTGKDFNKLIRKWTEFAPKVFYERPGHITEMHAYNLAAAHLELSHQISFSFMVSDATIHGEDWEGWPFIENQFNDTEVCMNPWLSDNNTNGMMFPDKVLPNTIHFCQRYMLGKWYFNKYFVPKDFFSCSAPLLAEPPQNVSLLYDFGITRKNETFKYPKLKLRKRIAFMMCQMIFAVNEAAIYYKNNHCKQNAMNMEKTFIFHDNMDIPIMADNNNEVDRSKKKMGNDITPPDIINVQTVRQGKEEDAQDKTREIHYHTVFSTGCAHQDWQSYLMFYHVWRSGQKGDATRVASGCSKEEEENLKKLHEEQIDEISPGNFHIHFTPDYSHVVPGGNYHFFNKGFGILHWLEHGLKYSENVHLYENDIFIILDPDQIVLRPFTNNFGDAGTGTATTLLKKTKTKKQQFVVQHGVPFAQQYGFSLGFDWFPKVNMSNVVTSKSELPSPVNNLTLEQAVEGYPIGPPYIMTGKDFNNFIRKWTDFAPRVFYEKPGHITEMHAYNLAAAHLQLSHQIAFSFMVSDVTGLRDKEGEGWPFIDSQFNETEVCMNPWSTDNNNTEMMFPDKILPNTMHFCQRYMLGKWFFNKYFIPGDFFSCSTPLFAEPPQNVSSMYDFGITLDKRTIKFPNSKRRIRIAFMMCQMIFAVNEAAIHYKKAHCDPDTVNMEKTFIFHDSMEITEYNASSELIHG